MNSNGNPTHPNVVVLMDPPHCPSYKVGVKTAADIEWVYNALRFVSWADANAYARDLIRRWVVIHSVAVHESDDEPNATFPVPSDRYAVKKRAEK